MPKPNRSTRNLLMHVLRAVRFLSLANWLRFVWSEVRDLPGNLRFRRRHRGFPVPPAWLAYDAYASTTMSTMTGWARLRRNIGLVSSNATAKAVCKEFWIGAAARLVS